MGLRLIINFPGTTGSPHRVMLRNAEAVNIGANKFVELTPSMWNFNTSLWDTSCPTPDNISAAATEVCAGLGLFSLVLPREFHKLSNLQLDFVLFELTGPVEDFANYTLLTNCGCSMNTGDSDLTLDCLGTHKFGNC